MSDILVFAQIEDGAINDVSLQCLGIARKGADASQGKVTALAIGNNISGPAAKLFQYGADQVLLAENPALENYLNAPYKIAFKKAMDSGTYRLILLPANTQGDDLAPMLAAEQELPVILDCDHITCVEGTLSFQRLEYDRKIHTSYKPDSEKTTLVTMKDGAGTIPEADSSKSGDLQNLGVEIDESSLKAKIKKRDVTGKTVNLKDARIIVGAGAGISSEENFGKIRELATALGAEIGATRAVVDAGWLPADHQIGQTGAVVRPDLYIACGISGAVQHWVGISESKTIIAINLDASAPIMKKAHYRIVGDLNNVVPKLTKILKN